MGYSNFYPYRGVEGKFPGDVAKAFPRESWTKTAFPRGQDKFSRGVITVRAGWGKFSRGVIPRKLAS